MHVIARLIIHHVRLIIQMAEGERQLLETVKNKSDVDSMEGSVCVRDLWKGENESDAEFMHLKDTDPLE